MTKLIVDSGAYIRRIPEKVPVQPTVALGIVVALVIAFAAVVVCSAVAAPRDSKQIGTVLESFLEATSRGDFGSAYEYFSVARQKDMSEGRFRAEVSADANFAGITSLKQMSLSKRPTSSQGPQKYDYRGRIAYIDGSTAELAATLVFDGGTWKIDSVGIGRPILD